MTVQRSQLKIQILAGIVAILLIIPMCSSIIHGFILGINSPEINNYETYPTGIEIIPTDNNNTNIINSNVGELKTTDIKRNIMLFIPSQYISNTLTIVSGIIAVAAIIMAIYYIISVIKMVSIIMRQGIMNRIALKQLRKVSYSMLTAYILFTIGAYLPSWYYNNYIQLDGYTFAHPEVDENFVIAITLILLTEILKIALQLKEEQDLTI